MTETFLSNVLEQGTAVRRLLANRETLAAAAARVPISDVGHVVFVGSGTSRYAGEVAAGVWRRLLGTCTHVVPTLPFLNADDGPALGPETLVVAISQSGNTLSLIEGVRHAAAVGSPTLGITANMESGLAEEADVTINTHTGQEAIYAKTRGFVTTALAASLAALELARSSARLTQSDAAQIEETLERLPDILSRTAEQVTATAGALADRLRTVRRLAVVGSGAQLPAAREGGLKILEVAKVLVSDYEIEESLHGPFNAFGADTGLVLLAGTIPQPQRLSAFIEAARMVGAPLVAIVEERVAANVLALGHDIQVPHLPFRPLSPLVGVVPLQVLAHELALARGVDPNATRYPRLYEVFGTKAVQG